MLDERKENRRLRLVQLLNEQFQGKQALFAEHTEISPNLISRYVRGAKGIGENMRDKIEDCCGKPRGWMDDSDTEMGCQVGLALSAVGAAGPIAGIAATSAAVSAAMDRPTLDERIAHASAAVVSVLKAASLDALCFGDIQSIKAAMKSGPQETYSLEEILRAAVQVFVEEHDKIKHMNEDELCQVITAFLRNAREVTQRTKKK